MGYYWKARKFIESVDLKKANGESWSDWEANHLLPWRSEEVNHGNKAHPHEELLKGVHEQLKEVLDESKQAIYVYLGWPPHDIQSKICFFIGIQISWGTIKGKGGFYRCSCDEKESRDSHTCYQHAIEDKIGSDIEVSLKTKTENL